MAAGLKKALEARRAVRAARAAPCEPQSRSSFTAAAPPPEGAPVSATPDSLVPSLPFGASPVPSPAAAPGTLSAVLSESLATMDAALEDAKVRTARTLAKLDEEKALDAAARADGGPAAAPAATEETEPTTAAPEPAATAELAPEPASTPYANTHLDDPAMAAARPCHTLDDLNALFEEARAHIKRVDDEIAAETRAHRAALDAI